MKMWGRRFVCPSAGGRLLGEVAGPGWQSTWGISVASTQFCCECSLKRPPTSLKANPGSSSSTALQKNQAVGFERRERDCDRTRQRKDGAGRSKRARSAGLCRNQAPAQRPPCSVQPPRSSVSQHTALGTPCDGFMSYAILLL